MNSHGGGCCCDEYCGEKFRVYSFRKYYLKASQIDDGNDIDWIAVFPQPLGFIIQLSYSPKCFSVRV